jgi:hypothetical protein
MEEALEGIKREVPDIARNERHRGDTHLEGALS